MTQVTISDSSPITDDLWAVNLIVVEDGGKTRAISARVPTSEMTPTRLVTYVRRQLGTIKAAETAKASITVGMVLDATEPAIDAPSAKSVWFGKFSQLIELQRIQAAGVGVDMQRITDLQGELKGTYDPAFVA